MARDFHEIAESLKAKRSALAQEENEIKKGLVADIQEVIDLFGFQASDFRFSDQAVSVKKRPRKPSQPLYRTKSGLTWSGRGRMKAEVAQYLAEHNLTKEDIMTGKDGKTPEEKRG